MNLREDDRVSAVALVMEDEADTSALVDEGPGGLEPIDELGPGAGGDARSDAPGGDAPETAPGEDPEAGE